MSSQKTFANIPIRVINTANPDGLAIAKALLQQLHAMLETLVKKGQGNVIDLRALPPLGVEGYQFLKETLGPGEVTAQIHSFGRSEIQETAYPGIWRITHFNQDGDTLTELIEVCFFPKILMSQQDDIIAGQGRLNEVLKGLAANS